MNYDSYDEYIQSKTYLIDKIPSHWEIVPMNQFVNLVTDYVANGSFATLRANVEYKNEEDYAILIRLADNTNNFSGPFVYIDEDAYNFLSKSKLYEGDIVLSNTGSIGSIFKVPNLGKPMSLGPNSLLIRFDNQILANYFFYLFDCDIGMKFLESITTVTTQPKFNKTDFRKLPMIMPPIKEQKQIANYLDKKTSKIDATIAKNEELIQLLEEKRVALINQVVTKGLNPDVPMKDSGVEWIGEIPEHYSIIKLKFLTSKIGSGKTPKGGSEIYVSEGIPLLRSQNIHFDSIRLDDVVYITDEINQSMLSTVVKKHDVLLNITGASIGRCNYVENIDIANVNQHVCILRPNKKIFYKYLNYFLQSECGQNQVFLNQNGTSREGLNFEDLSNFYIILPYDIAEQKTTVSFLEQEINKIFTSINKVKENISLLEEYKTSLIHHVVTGKIDVRGEQNE